MGIYTINCPQCKKPHQWFSGNIPDQRCAECKGHYQPEKRECPECRQEFIWLTPDVGPCDHCKKKETDVVYKVMQELYAWGVPNDIDTLTDVAQKIIKIVRGEGA